MLHFEGKHQRLAPLPVFLKRWAKHILLSAVLLGPGLGLGVAGYHWIAGFGWTDSILNASMILGGMGPMGELHTRGAKLFAAGYALFSGLLFIVLMGIVLAPLIRRMLHRFHLDEGEAGG